MRSKLASVLIAVSVLAGATAAAAAVGGGDEATSTADETTTTTTAAPTTTVAPTTTTTTTSPAPAPLAAPDPTSSEGCGDGTYTNHGAYVSSVAHDPDRQPGDVPTAAHSDCGKPTTATDTSADDADDADDVEAVESDSGSSAHGKSEGKGHANGH